MELWGGPECTVNRVGDAYRDQTRLTGHHDRPGDLAAFAALGIEALRYPLLWERVAPDAPADRDWTWSDARLLEIRDLGMRPIAGLIHHGSGPRYTTLVADDFVPLFTDYAAAAAERYPWIDDWTPVNEPLTTARFSALYGFWYPHARDARAFWTALLNQIDATRGAMAAIRRVNPAARLIQTEDLGFYYSTPELADVAARYNERRWLTWDLLAGRVTPGHAMWPEIESVGLADRARAMADDPCPPDIVGVNHYVTSERFLDHREHAFPKASEGYHDLAAARVLHPPPLGLDALLRQAWDRYGLPIAITECHLGCTREEQLRWLSQSWETCAALAADGVDIRALTAWALLGNVDWSSLITRDRGDYEPGAWDVSGPRPRPTALAGLLRGLGGDADALARWRAHPVLAGPGWWQRDVRLEHPQYAWAEPGEAIFGGTEPDVRPILITGATGTLGRALAGACDLRGLAYVLTDRATLPIDDPRAVARILDLHAPWAVINAAGWVRVDDAEGEADACMAANAEGSAVLARACAARDIHYTAFSSDLVFDGETDSGYFESDIPRPLNVYGRSKAEAERLVAEAGGRALVVRTAAFFSPYDEHNFAMHVERTLRGGGTVRASGDHFVTPTYVPDLVNACLDLVIDDETGLWHLANATSVSWLEFGRLVADAMGLDPARVEPADPDDLGWRALRPLNAALRSERGKLLPPLAHAVARFAATRRRYLKDAERRELAA